jgi:alpha-tubulin suppressor-like RCC1 family protein
MAVDVAGLIDAEALLDAHSYVTCARRRGGEVVCWGRANLGQLGPEAAAAEPRCRDNDSPESLVACSAGPVELPAVRGAEAIAIGREHACALVQGVVSCWGTNTHGQVGGPDELVEVPTEIDLPGPAIGIAAGSYHSCALLADGTVSCWGLNSEAQLGVDPLAVGQRSAPLEVGGLPSAVTIAAGHYHTCVLTSDRELWCWGDDESGALSDGEPGTDGPTPTRALRAEPTAR